MHIDQFCEKVKQELDEFVTKFKKMNKTDPESWPLEMSEEAWFEQMVCELTREEDY